MGKHVELNAVDAAFAAHIGKLYDRLFDGVKNSAGDANSKTMASDSFKADYALAVETRKIMIEHLNGVEK